jgi:UDP-hydrolysing UDP-N-acetyl-D-glucosamine 2-epimerase
MKDDADVRRIAVFSCSRADLWPLVPVVQALADDPRADVRVLLSGAHASEAQGATAEVDVARSHLEIVGEPVDGDGAGALVRHAASCGTGISASFDRWRPDILVVLGDRYELLAVALAATVHRVAIAHVHGGELTFGAIDEGVRHAITKLAHLHFCATEEYASRVKSMGEEPWRVHVTGAPGIDRLLGLARRASLDDLEQAIGRPVRRPFGLVTYHPPTADPRALEGELEAVITGTDALETVLVTAPGADVGWSRVLAILDEWQRARPDAVVIVPTLGELYATAMACADVVVGNSSSGIIEAPSLGVPVVNVGRRQEGRVRGQAVIDVSGTPASVRAGVDRALSASFRDVATTASNPYGDGSAAPRIARMLVDTPLDGLLLKRFEDRP